MSENTTVTGRNLDNQQVTLQTSKPYQLDLFQTFLPDDEKYFNTLDLWDAIPKYFASPKKMEEMRINGQFLPTLTRNFTHRGEHYTVEISPARIKEIVRTGSSNLTFLAARHLFPFFSPLSGLKHLLQRINSL